MLDQDTLDQCRSLIARYDSELGWSLDAATHERYAAAVAPLLAGLPEERWRAVAANYHADHEAVAALQDAAHPDHGLAWSRWCAQVIAVLRHAGRAWSPNGALEIEDLAQAARIALLRALPGYGYRSRFTSWAYSVIDRSARDQLRAAQAKRRSGPTRSLEQLIEAEQPAAPYEAHEQQARSRLLAERVAAVLGAHRDQRLERIFHMWALEDWTSAEIGAAVGLHESRVRALLKLSRELLRADPEIRRWVEHES